MRAIHTMTSLASSVRGCASPRGDDLVGSDNVPASDVVYSYSYRSHRVVRFFV